MGKEAVLPGLGVDVDVLGPIVQATSLGLEVTTDYCILQQIQVVWDLWVSYECLILTAGQDQLDTDTAVLEAIDEEATPLFNAMNVAVGYCAANRGVCTESFATSDWEELTREASHLSEWTQRIAKDLCWMSRGVTSRCIMRIWWTPSIASVDCSRNSGLEQQLTTFEHRPPMRR